MKKIVVVLLGLVLLGCEKNITVNLDNTTPKLVVEASIENGQPPVVVLSKSLGLFTQLTPALLTQSFVHNADVFVSNGSLTHKLKEYTVPVAPGIQLFYYSIDSANLATAFNGQVNTAYSLRILTAGEEYKANTTIPKITKQIDSMWWKPSPDGDTSKRVVMVRNTDPPGFGDYVRVLVKVNSQPFLAPRTSAFDDLFVDGTTYELQLTPGVDRNVNSDFVSLFNRGDTVTMKLSNIDKATFDFWQTLEFSYNGVGNPFATPVKVKSNISNGALGYFGGYAAQFRTLIVK